MKKQYFIRRIVLPGLFALLAITGMSIAGQEDAAPFIISATAEGITVPEGLVAGLTTLVFENESEAPFAPIIVRLNEGKTMQDLMRALQAGLAEGLEVVTVLGNPEVEAGDSYEVTYDLLAGDYVLLSFAAGGPPTILPFSVTTSEADPEVTPEPLDPDVVAKMGDFVFAIPTEIEAGAQLWQIENVGEQAHHMLVYAIEDDVTLEVATAAFMDAMMNATAGPPQMPYESVFSWGVMSPGQAAYLELELEPGTYVFVCFLPDQAAEDQEAAMSHLEHGMIRIVTVGE